MISIKFKDFSVDSTPVSAPCIAKARLVRALLFLGCSWDFQAFGAARWGVNSSWRSAVFDLRLRGFRDSGYLVFSFCPVFTGGKAEILEIVPLPLRDDFEMAKSILGAYRSLRS